LEENKFIAWSLFQFDDPVIYALQLWAINDGRCTVLAFNYFAFPGFV